MSKKFNLDAMSIDEMWQLHEEINAVLSIRLTSEKRELEKRLAQLRREKEMRQSEAPDSQAKMRLGSAANIRGCLQNTEIRTSLRRLGPGVGNNPGG